MEEITVRNSVLRSPARGPSLTPVTQSDTLTWVTSVWGGLAVMSNDPSVLNLFKRRTEGDAKRFRLFLSEVSHRRQACFLGLTPHPTQTHTNTQTKNNI